MHGVGCWDSQLMQALLLPYPGCPMGTVAWLPTPALSFLFQRLKAWLKYLDLTFCTFNTGSPSGDTLVQGSRGRRVRYTGDKVAALSALRTHHLPARALLCIEKITAKALLPKQSTLVSFIISLFQEIG